MFRSVVFLTCTNTNPVNNHQTHLHNGLAEVSEHLFSILLAEVSEAASPPHRFPTKFKSAGQLNIHAVYLHILGDALGSVIVMLSALIIIFAEGEWCFYLITVNPLINARGVYLIF